MRHVPGVRVPSGRPEPRIRLRNRPVSALFLGLGALALPGCAGATPEGDVASPGFTVIQGSILDGIRQSEVSYPSDSLTVRGYLFLPPGEGRLPAVIFNHGGVSGVNADMMRRGRDLAELGYVVFAPSYRGEGGSEGRVEVAAGEVTDVLAAADILARHPRVDGSRLAVTGSSHGALISVLAAARHPGKFRCVVSACGVLDVVRWYRYLVENGFDVSDSLSVAVYGQGPEDRPEAFRLRRAVLVAPRIQGPVLLQQGEKDSIVPVEQAHLFDRALREAGHPGAELKFYPLLGHAFWLWDESGKHSPEELAQAEDAWADFVAFLERHLKSS